MASSDSQIDKPQRGRPKSAEILDVNINTGAQSINTDALINAHAGITNGSYNPLENRETKHFALYVGGGDKHG